MFITFTVGDIMIIVFSFLFWFLFVFLLWPLIVSHAIKRNPEEGGEKCGERFLVIGILVFASFYLPLVLSDAQRSWMDTEPAITAILITAAIFFSYSRFLPSSFYAAYVEVTNFETGDWNKKRLRELTIERGKFWPIFLVVHNTGIAPWNNYRITVEFGDKFEAKVEMDDFPNSETWGWMNKDLRIGERPCWVQVQRTNVLVIGEPQTLRFFIRSDKVGRFKLRMRVVSDSRPGERRQTLWLNVN
ncbi:hypothetical protein ES703_46735 [subsurface metagenome]